MVATGCPKCGGKGRVTLFTSNELCPLGCKPPTEIQEVSPEEPKISSSTTLAAKLRTSKDRVKEAAEEILRKEMRALEVAGVNTGDGGNITLIGGDVTFSNNTGVTTTTFSTADMTTFTLEDVVRAVEEFKALKVESEKVGALHRYFDRILSWSLELPAFVPEGPKRVQIKGSTRPQEKPDPDVVSELVRRRRDHVSEEVSKMSPAQQNATLKVAIAQHRHTLIWALGEMKRRREVPHEFPPYKTLALIQPQLFSDMIAQLEIEQYRATLLCLNPKEFGDIRTWPQVHPGVVELTNDVSLIQEGVRGYLWEVLILTSPHVKRGEMAVVGVRDGKNDLDDGELDLVVAQVCR